MEAAASVDADASPAVDSAAAISIGSCAVPINAPVAVDTTPTIVAPITVPTAAAIRSAVKADAAAPGRLGHADAEPPLLQCAQAKPTPKEQSDKHQQPYASHLVHSTVIQSTPKSVNAATNDIVVQCGYYMHTLLD